MPATVVLDQLLARTPTVAVWVADALAFPSGLAFCLTIQWAGRKQPDGPVLWARGVPGGPRFSIELADGRSVSAAFRPADGAPSRAEGPLLLPRAGGATGYRERADLWLSPLPPPGRLTFAFEWPNEGIAESRQSIDGGSLREAVGRAVELWPDDRPVHPRLR